MIAIGHRCVACKRTLETITKGLLRLFELIELVLVTKIGLTLRY